MSSKSEKRGRLSRSRKIVGVTALIGLAALTACEPANEGAQLTPGVIGSVQFGWTVAMSGNGLRMAVSMPLDGPDSRVGAGSVKVYSRQSSDLAWSLEETLNEPSAGAKFGTSLDLSTDGNLLAVGAPYDDSRDGRVYVYKRGAGDWSESMLVRPPVNGRQERHGEAVALGAASGSPVLAIGAPFAAAGAVVNAGVVRLYTIDLSTNKATLRATTTSNAVRTDARFGNAIDMAETDLVVGEPNSPLQAADGGAAHHFKKAAAAWTWSHNGQIQSRIGVTDNYVIDDGSKMGTSVAISADRSTIAVGSPEYADGKGAVVVAKKNASGTYDSVRRLYEAAGLYSGNAGQSVALNSDGSLLLLGAQKYKNFEGLYGLFDLTSTQEKPKYYGVGKSGDGVQSFGYSVAMSSSGKIFAVGAPRASSSVGMTRTFDTYTKPGAPTIVRTVAGDGGVAVVWSAPAGTTSELTNTYTVTASPGGRTCTSAGLVCIVSGLTNGTAYTFTVTATNAKGAGTASTASAPVTPVAGQAGQLNNESILDENGNLVVPEGGQAGFGTVPGAPTDVKVVGGRRKVTISWTAPASNGGQAVQAYQVTASPSGRQCVATTETTCTIAKLGDNTSHTFSVVAVNINGASQAARVNTKTWTQPRVSRSQSATAKDIARFGGLKTPNKAKYSVKVIGKNSPNFCTVKNGEIIGKSSGACRVRVSVTSKGVTTSKNVVLRTVR